MNKKLISLAAAAALLSASLGAAVFAAEPVGYDYIIYENNFENAKTGAGLSEEDTCYRPENANYAVIEENGEKYYTFSPSSTEKLGLGKNMPLSYSKKVVDADFDSDTALSSEWDKKGASGLTYTVVSAQNEELPDAEKHGNVLKIAKETDNSTDNYFRIAYGLVADKCSVKELKRIQTGFDIYIPEKSNINLRYLDNISGSSTKGDTLITFSDNGTIKFLGSTKSIEYSEKCWYSFDLFFDFRTKTYSVYINGEPAEENLPLKNLDTCIISFGFQAAATAGRYTHYWDNILFAVPDAFKAVKTYPADGAENVSVLDNASITMSNPIDGFDSSYVTVTENGSLYNNYEVSCEDNIITLKFPQGLEYESEYEIRVSSGMRDIFDQTPENDIAVAFTSMSRGVAASVPVFTDENGKILNEWPQNGVFEAAASAKNGGAEEKKIALITAVYNSDYSVKEIYVDEKNIAGGGEESFETCITAAYEEGCIVKAFMCETDGIYKMLREEYAAVPSEDTEYVASEAELTLENLSLDKDKLKIEGRLSSNEVKTVLVTVIDDKENIVMTMPLRTQTGGVFNLCFKLLGNSDGVFTVYANGANISNTDSKSIVYLTDTKKSEIAKSINKAESIYKAESEQSVETVMEQNKSLLNLDSSIFNGNTYRVIYEQRPYDSYDEFTETAVLADNLMKQVNEADWSTLTQLFKDYGKIILCGVENLSKYNAYSEPKQNKINKELVKKSPFADFEQLRAEFDDAVANYKEPASIGGGGGSSSGGGSVAASYNVTVPEISVPDAAAKPEKQVFGDLNLAPWAEESILALCEKGVISADDNYRPLDNVKREEFVKLLTEMLGIAKTDKACGFTDAEEGQWYCGYLSAARNAGIINGNTDGSFGVGSNITRQDMAVMAYRGITAAGRKIMPATEAAPFTDSSAISEYAKQAVEEMQKAGIISGTGGGAFEPESYANRAQAAVIIYNLMLAADGEAVK